MVTNYRHTPPLPPRRPNVTVTPGLPASFATLGILAPEQARKTANGLRRLMLSTEGVSDTGKTEFMFTAPGPGCVIACDRGFDAMIDNPTPPPSRRSDFGVKVIQLPGSTEFATKEQYVPYWMEYLQFLLNALRSPDIRTLCIDGDNVTWETQRLAEHGKLTGIFPQTRYTDVYAARRALLRTIHDSGKIIIASNMMRDEYKPILDSNGEKVPDPDKPGEFKKERTGDYVAQGFSDVKHDYYWQIRLRHLYEPPTPGRFNKILKREVGATPARWGFRIMKAKANPTLVGEELWGEEATFLGLVQKVYPHIDPAEWGL